MSGYQVMPRLTPDEYDELEQSILAHGVQVPITVGPDGTIIDGHHRDEIARKHDLHCPRVTAEGDAATLRGLAFSLNLDRRHLSREQKRQIVAESIKADPQLSDREHGRRTGVSKNTAASVRDELTESGQVDHFSERIDPRTGNASQPASRPPRPAPEPSPLPPGFAPGDLDELNTPAPDRDRDADHLHVPQRQRQTPITDRVMRIMQDLDRNIEKLQEATGDPRYNRYREDIAARHKNTITTAINTLKEMQ